MLFAFRRLTQHAHNPIKNMRNSLGFDIKIPYNYLIPKKSDITVQLDLEFNFSENCYGIMSPTLSLSRDYFLTVLNGKQIILNY